MRIVSPKYLKKYADAHPQARIPLLHWKEICQKAEWNNLNDIRADYNSVDYVGNNRYVFNIKGNDYRLIAIVIFISGKIYIRFIGKHDEYDKINAKTI